MRSYIFALAPVIPKSWKRLKNIITTVSPKAKSSAHKITIQPLIPSTCGLFDVNLDVLTVFVIHHVNDFAGHAGAQSVHYIRHIHAFDLRCEMRSDLQPGVDQAER